MSDFSKTIADTAVRLGKALDHTSNPTEWRSISADPPIKGVDEGPIVVQLLGKEVHGTLRFDQNDEPLLWLNRSRSIARVVDFELWRRA